jgi:ATP-dependent Lhr-like helicase
VDKVNHEDRVVAVREAPAGVKPSWGGYIPSMLGFELCQRIEKLLTEDTEYPYVDAPTAQYLRAQRDDLGELLRRPGAALQVEPGVARWWTFAGGRVNHTLKYGLEIKEGWKVVADNFLVRIEGDGIGHETVGAAISRMSLPGFWTDANLRKALLGRLPNYRLSKFQDCLPEAFALEVVENYLLDVASTVRWLAGTSS